MCEKLLMKNLFLVFILLHTISNAKAQIDDSAAVIRKLDMEVRSGKKSIQDILAADYLMPLHPQKPFRDLVKEFGRSSEMTLNSPTEQGKKIKVVAIVRNQSNRPVRDAQVYCYQTDSRGWYGSQAPHFPGMEGDRRQARIFGYLRTDDKGKFILHTIQPHGYPGSNLPAHIHVEITAENYHTIITEFLFDDDKRLTPDIRERSQREGFLVSKASSGNIYQYAVILQLR